MPWFSGKVDQLDNPGFAAVVVLRFVVRQQLRNAGGLARDGPVAADRVQQPTGPRGDFHIVVLGGRGERLDGIKTDLAQIGFGLLADEVIGVAQGLDQAVDLFRRWPGRREVRGGKKLRRGGEEKRAGRPRSG